MRTHRQNRPASSDTENAFSSLNDRDHEPLRSGEHGAPTGQHYAIREGLQGRKRWIVAFSRSGRPVQISFAHAPYGGEAPALAVAIACRDAALAAHQPLTNRQMRMIVRRNRVEGVPGVYRLGATAKRSATWIGHVTLSDGRMRRRTFAVDRHSEDGARELAEEARLRLLDEVDDIEDAALRNREAVPLRSARVRRREGRRTTRVPCGSPGTRSGDRSA